MKTFFIFFAAAAAFVAFAVLPFITFFVYEKYFEGHIDTCEYRQFYVEDFPGLKQERDSFISDKGQRLAAYRYWRGSRDEAVKGLVVFAHGLGGGGQSGYMNWCSYFTEYGYKVFAYDATGNNESEGGSPKGGPQGIIDLDYALNYAATVEEYEGLPIILFGHSWGGYSVGSVLNLHPEVRGALMVAAFNASYELIESWGEQEAGWPVHLIMPYVKLYERLKFGEYASLTAIDGFGRTEARIMIMHSSDDDIMPIKYGYDAFYRVYGNNPRFTFLRYDNKDHGFIFYTDEAIDYRRELNRAYSKYLKEKGLKPSDEERNRFMKENMDLMRACETDGETMERVLEFFGSCTA